MSKLSTVVNTVTDFSDFPCRSQSDVECSLHTLGLVEYLEHRPLLSRAEHFTGMWTFQTPSSVTKTKTLCNRYHRMRSFCASVFGVSMITVMYSQQIEHPSQGSGFFFESLTFFILMRILSLNPGMGIQVFGNFFHSDPLGGIPHCHGLAERLGIPPLGPDHGPAPRSG